MLDKGLIQIYTAKSEHFNFAPIGLSLRASGQGLRTLITCFFPHELMEGAGNASLLLKPNLVIEHNPNGQKPFQKNEKGPENNGFTKLFKRARDAVVSGDFDIVILSGINKVLSLGLLPLEEILDLMEDKPDRVELVLSGPNANQEIIEKADLVTEMVVHKSGRALEPGNCPQGNGTTEVVTGNGKGKTTYCLGKGMLTSCVGVHTLVFQFIKSPKPYGEVKAIEKLPYLEIKTMGKGFLNKHSPFFDKKHAQAARHAWQLWLKQIYSQEYGLLVMDEINIATHHGLINGERVREMLFLRPHKSDILLSGRNAHPDVVEAATTVIEMKEIKHPFKKGIRARKGIEY